MGGAVGGAARVVAAVRRLDGEAGAPAVDDHDFTPPADRRWDRCVVCKLGQAAHTRVPNPYVPTAPRAPREGKP